MSEDFNEFCEALGEKAMAFEEITASLDPIERSKEVMRVTNISPNIYGLIPENDGVSIRPLKLESEPFQEIDKSMGFLVDAEDWDHLVALVEAAPNFEG